MSRAVRRPLTAAVAALLPAGLSSAAPRSATDPAPRVDRVSAAADGGEADNHSEDVSVTANGRFASFTSSAKNLVTDMPGGVHLSYVRNLRTGTNTVFTDGVSAPSVSEDGRWVAYSGWGSREIEIYLTDRTTGERKLVKAPNSRGAYHQALSGDGRYLAFAAYGPHPSKPDSLALYDRKTDRYEDISAGQPGVSKPKSPSISADGRFVAYEDTATEDVYVRDRDKGTLTQLDGAEAARIVEVSRDGHHVVWTTAEGTHIRDLRTGRTRDLPGVKAEAVAPDGRQLLAEDSGGALVLRDLRTGRETPVSGGAPATAVPGSVAEGGRTVVFGSASPDVVPGDTNGQPDVFRYRP